MKHFFTFSSSILLSALIICIASCGAGNSGSTTQINCGHIEIQDNSHGGLSCTAKVLTAEHQAQICSLAILNNGVECSDGEVEFRVTEMSVEWISNSPGAWGVSGGSVTTILDDEDPVTQEIDPAHLTAFAAILKAAYCTHAACSEPCQSGQRCTGSGACEHEVALAGGVIIAVVSDVDGGK
jgi:hypothetical protein